MRNFSFAGCLTLALALGSAHAQAPAAAPSAPAFTPPAADASGGWPPPGPLGIHRLTKSVYWADGAGGNSGIIVGAKGVIVVDTKVVASSGKELVADVAKITPKPITAVILTHGDIDHGVGLAEFPPGIQIIAQKATQKRMQEESAAGHGLVPPDKVPNRAVGDKETLQLGGTTVELLHWAPAHTDGDLVIYLPKEKIVFTGDIFTEDPLPLIHRDLQGTSEGWLKTAQGIVALDANRFVMGHGEVQTKQALKKRLAVAVAEKKKVQQMVSQGKSLAQIQAAVNDPPPGQIGYGPPHFPAFSEVVYDELTGKK
jgi:glyoxylase-like metal-dependent hydrolase (beta-lactamase superfamily II)